MNCWEVEDDTWYRYRVVYHRWVEMRKQYKGIDFDFVFKNVIEPNISVRVRPTCISLFDDIYPDDAFFEMGLRTKENKLYFRSSTSFCRDEILIDFTSEYCMLDLSKVYSADVDYASRMIYIDSPNNYNYDPDYDPITEEVLFQRGLLFDCITFEEYQRIKKFYIEVCETPIKEPGFYTFGNLEKMKFEYLSLMKNYI